MVPQELDSKFSERTRNVDDSRLEIADCSGSERLAVRRRGGEAARRSPRGSGC